VILTKHAAERWAYRCQGLDLVEEMASARQLTHKRLARLKGHSGGTKTPGATYWLSRGGVLFVIAPGGKVVTVMRVASA
jgi:hypothetical protein